MLEIKSGVQAFLANTVQPSHTPSYYIHPLTAPTLSCLDRPRPRYHLGIPVFLTAKQMRISAAAHTQDPSTVREKQENQVLKDSLGYTRTFFQNIRGKWFTAHLVSELSQLHTKEKSHRLRDGSAVKSTTGCSSESLGLVWSTHMMAYNCF